MSLIEPPADAVAPEPHPEAPAPGERIPPHSPVCLGCADVPYGLRIESWAAAGVGVLSRFVVRPEHQGAPGLLHGGMLTTAFDECLGVAHGLVAHAAVTARLETDFRRPVPVGATLWLHSRVDAVVGRKLYVSAVARLEGHPDDAGDDHSGDHSDDDPGSHGGPVAGTARALFLRVGLEHFLRHGRPEDLEAVGATPDAIAAARTP